MGFKSQRYEPALPPQIQCRGNGPRMAGQWAQKGRFYCESTCVLNFLICCFAHNRNSRMGKRTQYLSPLSRFITENLRFQKLASQLCPWLVQLRWVLWPFLALKRTKFMERKKCWFYREGVEVHTLSAWDQVDESGSIVHYHPLWSSLCSLRDAACSITVTNRPGDNLQIDTLRIWDDIAGRLTNPS